MAKTPGFKQDRTIGDILASGRKPKLEPNTGWVNIGVSEEAEIPFEGYWANGGDEAPVGFYLSHNGEVRLRGDASGYLDGTDLIIFVLPEEARPEFDTIFVTPVLNFGLPTGSIDLSGIRFRSFQS